MSQVSAAHSRDLAYRIPCDDQGFTLIELLVAILIVGILAAIAIPTFLSATNGANDTAAKQMADTARIAARSLGLDNGGSFATVGKATLHSYDPTIATTKADTDAYVSAASGTEGTYTVTVESVATGDKFTIVRSAEGTVTRTCKLPSRSAPPGGCKNIKGAQGTW